MYMLTSLILHTYVNAHINLDDKLKVEKKKNTVCSKKYEESMKPISTDEATYNKV